MFKPLATALCVFAVGATLSAQTPTTSKSAAAPEMKKAAVTRTAAKKETQASLRKEAKISLKTARATALKEVPNGKIRSSELERENGKLIYSFDIKVAGKSGIEEVNVDAVTGAVAGHEHETPKTEKKEEAAEKKK